jgi:GNAT superfamily N-acetyltransferase
MTKPSMLSSKETLSKAQKEKARLEAGCSAEEAAFRREITLRDGSSAIVRPISSDDKPALLEFHANLSPDTKFLRYHYSKGDLTEEDLKTFCEIDYRDNLALIAEGLRNGKKQILGVGRYSRLPAKNTAEVAFVVRDSEQNKGIGSLLLKYLAEFAWKAGLDYFCGEVLRQNGKMLAIFRHSDPTMKQEIDCPTTCEVTVSVAEARRNEP